VPQLTLAVAVPSQAAQEEGVVKVAEIGFGTEILAEQT